MSNTVEWNSFAQVVCEHLGLKPGEFTEETHIYNDIGIDSLGIMTLGMKMQKAFHIKVPLSVVAGINTLGDMLAIMNKYAEYTPN